MSDDKTPRVGIDRRDFARIPAKIEIRFSLAQDAAKALMAYSVNISASGLCLKTQRVHEVGQELHLSVLIADEAFELRGVVAWSRSGAVGVRFVDLSDRDVKRLERVCENLRTES